jgi:hypothetical protein
MDPGVWAAVLRHIPAEQHNLFTVVTTGGVEISLASILRVEDEFAVVKGRLSGSQDAGRVFFVPYKNFEYFGYTAPVKDEDYLALFGTFVVPQPAPPEPEVPVMPPPSPYPVMPVARPSSLARPSSFDRPAIRSEVLEKFRSRSSQP